MEDRANLAKISVTIARMLWSGEKVSYKDRYFSFMDVELSLVIKTDKHAEPSDMRGMCLGMNEESVRSMFEEKYIENGLIKDEYSLQIL